MANEPETGAGHAESEAKEVLFFEKKNQKTFIRLVPRKLKEELVRE
jgi:hypothetical protein